MTTAGYGQFYSSGLGFRAGLQWTSSVATVEHAFGLPLSVVWRSPSRTPSERVYSGAAGAMRGYGYSSLDGAVGSLLAGFSVDFSEKGLKGIKDYHELAEFARERFEK